MLPLHIRWRKYSAYYSLLYSGLDPELNGAILGDQDAAGAITLISNTGLQNLR